MRVLEYDGLDTTGVSANYRKVHTAIARGDFHAAQVKKLVGHGHGRFYRARLDDSNRLLFTLLRHENELCVLLLEVIRNHDYAASRFLRGANIDEAHIPVIDKVPAESEAQSLRYLHPARAEIHLLDKPISFDDAQQAIYSEPWPMIVAGSAGSGKTALTLEKLKRVEGNALFVTHSAYLARSARDLYYAGGFEHPAQEADFLSFREFVESIRVPPGREAGWREFAAWFTRMRQTFKGIDAHQAFEEIRGVIGARADGALSCDAYQALGVRQSIFLGEDRARLYALFEKYREWLGESGLYDINLVAREWQRLAQPRYDYMVIDEVQDFTPVQLALALATLKHPGHFLLCGDSNQIVHPNFFSWSQIRALFWRDATLAEHQQLRVLTANFRNGAETTRVANTLLEIKQRRFGSIDRESNFLVEAVGAEAGRVDLLPDRETIVRDLDQKTRKSTQFAVLVPREEDKAAARRYFATPLLFSIHEAKGLEYESIVLYRFVSENRAEFGEIVAGVQRSDLTGDALEYSRARDKSDKSLEVYKFFVNALYVALTRAVKNVFLIESDTAHPLFRLLDLGEAAQLRLESRQATAEDWQKEARKLELQGKQEQADAIRRTILHEVAPPWPVADETRVRELLLKVFREQVPGAKPRQQLYEYATCFDEPVLATALAQEARYDAARAFSKQRATLGYKSLMPYYAGNPKDILRQCDQYGVEHRLPMNLTPLMAAATAGNIALLDALIERGADREACDHYGRNALHWGLLEAFGNGKYAAQRFAAVYDRVAPASIDVNVGERLVRIDRHLSEYLLFQTLWALFKSRFSHPQRSNYGAFEAQAILDAWRNLPATVLRPERNRRPYLSGVLARNEVDRDYAYNRALFKRVAQGWYQFNPALCVRRRRAGDEQWVAVYTALNLPLVAETSVASSWRSIAERLGVSNPSAHQCLPSGWLSGCASRPINACLRPNANKRVSSHCGKSVNATARPYRIRRPRSRNGVHPQRVHVRSSACGSALKRQRKQKRRTRRTRILRRRFE